MLQSMHSKSLKVSGFFAQKCHLMSSYVILCRLSVVESVESVEAATLPPVLCASGEHAGVSGHSLGCRWHCRCHALSTRFLHVAWLCQATSISKQPQMLPMYAMLQLRIKSFSDGQESKHQQIMRNLHLRLIPPGASFISFHLRCCFRSAVGAHLFARLTARHGVFLFTFFTARNISLWRERGSLREVGGVGNNVLLRCALI
jgi:hypothetical protein